MSGDTLQLVLQGGALALLTLVLIGIGAGVKLLIPVVREALADMRADRREAIKAQQDGTAAMLALASKIEGGISALHARVELAEQRMGAVVDRARADLESVIRERASHTADEIRDELRLPTGEHPALQDRPITPGRGFPPIRPPYGSTPGRGT